MDFRQLMPDERFALAALVRTMVRLDRSYSAEESSRLHAIAEELGDPEAFWDAIEQAEQRVADGAQLEQATLAVTRPDARALILDVLESLSVADAGSEAEQKMIADVRALWERGKAGAPYRG